MDETYIKKKDRHIEVRIVQNEMLL